MHKSPVAGHIAYVLSRNDELRTAINKLPPTQQVAEIQKMEAQIAFDENGKDFSERVKLELNKEELADLKKALESNQAAAEVVVPFMRELHQDPNGPQVLKALAHNPELSRRLAGLSPALRLIELGRLSARLDKNEKPVRRAPEPIKPDIGGTTRSSIPLDKTDMADFKRRRAAGQIR
jgi:hypothetical protein